MMFPPFAATSRVAPIAVNFRRALTTTRLNHSISAVTCACLNKGHLKSVQTIARTRKDYGKSRYTHRNGLLRGEHQQRLVFTPALVDKPR